MKLELINKQIMLYQSMQKVADRLWFGVLYLKNLHLNIIIYVQIGFHVFDLLSFTFKFKNISYYKKFDSKNPN